MGLTTGSGKNRTLRPDWMKKQTDQTRDAYFDGAGPTAFDGSWQADLNPRLQGAWDNLYNSENQNQFMDNLAGLGQFGMDFGSQAVNQGMDFIQGLQDRGPNQFQYDQGTYDTSFNNLTGGLQNQFDLGALEMQQNFDWNQLPGLNMSNAMGGGQGSTKFGQTGALGQAMTNQNIANFGSGLWQNAANQAHAAGMTGGLNNLQSANQFDQNMVGNYQNYGNLGMNLANSANTGAFNMAQGISQNQLTAGQGAHAYDQQGVDLARQQHYYDEQRDLDYRRQQFMDASNVARQFAVAKSPSASTLDKANQWIDTAGNVVGVVGDIASIAKGTPNAGGGGYSPYGGGSAPTTGTGGFNYGNPNQYSNPYGGQQIDQFGNPVYTPGMIQQPGMIPLPGQNNSQMVS